MSIGGYPQARYSSFHQQVIDPDSSFKLNVKDDLQDSVQMSQVVDNDEAASELNVSTRKDEKIVLIQDSVPNYAKIDHFSGQDLPQSDDDSLDNEQQQPPKKTQGPSVNEQLRKIREEVAKEYDEKYKASLDDIDQYKLQMERMLKDQEQRQNAIVSRSMGDKDKLIQQLNTHKTQLQNEISQLESVVKEKEEIIEDQVKTIELLRGEIDKMSKREKEVELKSEIVNTYMENMKRQVEEFKFQFEQANQMLTELRKQDWSKQIIELKGENEFLREEIMQKQKEFSNLKNNLAMAIQTSPSPSNVQSHLTNLLETQSQEVVRMSRLVQEFERKEKQCTRKWNTLLQENIQLSEKLNAQKQQVLRQREQFQNVISQGERKIIEANHRLAWVQQSEDKRAAAEYLVQQIQIAGEEKQGMMSEIDNLNLRIQDIQDEYQRLLNETKDYLQVKGTISNNGGPDNHLQAQQRLLMRIEELEDLVVELKTQQSPRENVDLRALLVSKEQEIKQLNNKIAEIRKTKVTAKNLFDNNELYETFKKAVDERNEVILRLKKELQNLKTASFAAKIQQQPLSNSAANNDLANAMGHLGFGRNSLGQAGLNTFTHGWAADQNERDEWLVQKLPSGTKAQI